MINLQCKRGKYGRKLCESLLHYFFFCQLPLVFPGLVILGFTLSLLTSGLFPIFFCSVLFQVQQIFGHLLESKLQYYVPETFWNVFKLWGQQINIREQQDALDFYQALIDQCEEHIKVDAPLLSPVINVNFKVVFPVFNVQKLGKESPLKKTFQGIYSDQKICKDCPHRCVSFLFAIHSSKMHCLNVVCSPCEGMRERRYSLLWMSPSRTTHCKMSWLSSSRENCWKETMPTSARSVERRLLIHVPSVIWIPCAALLIVLSHLIPEEHHQENVHQDLASCSLHPAQEIWLRLGVQQSFEIRWLLQGNYKSVLSSGRRHLYGSLSILQFPFVLDMEPYTAEGMMEREDEKSSEESMDSEGDSPIIHLASVPKSSDTDSDISDSKYRQDDLIIPETEYAGASTSKRINYELVGVVVHSGQAHAGHYYSFIKDRR